MITPSFALTATERVLPRLALDFTTASLDSRITFTRSGATATRVNSSGYVEVMAADTPRFDFDPVTLVCKGLLVEETRQNLRSYSEEFNNAVWVTSNSSISADFAGITAPSGTQTADKLIRNNGATAGHVVSSLSLTSGTTYTYSCYAKAGERDIVRLRVIGTAGWASAVVNLSTGAVTSSVGTVVVSNAGGGWYRIAVTAACDLTGTNAVYVYDNSATAGNGSDGFYIWGAQLEAGAFPTSYIPTEASALTRNADVATMTGTNFSDWFNASEGTFVVKSSILQYAPLTAPAIFAASDGTVNNRLQQFYGGVSTISSRIVVSGAATNPANNTTDINNSGATALAYKVSSAAACADGNAVTTSLPASIPSVNTLYIGSDFRGLSHLNGHLQNLNFYKQRLLNAEMQSTTN